jgi:hypothetical protein
MAQLYFSGQELETLASRLSPAELSMWCLAQPIPELMGMLEKIKTNRSLPQAESLASVIIKRALASEDLEAFIGKCLDLLSNPAWSPDRADNKEFWRKLVSDTFPARHAGYNQLIQRMWTGDTQK